MRQNAAQTVILLVEDEPVVREITARVLRNAGYVVLETGTPSEALRRAAQHKEQIDLLLTDVVMPEMNGVDLAERIRNARPEVATVFMSGYVQGEILHKAAKPVMHIQKPFTVNSLLSGVAEALRRPHGPTNIAQRSTDQCASALPPAGADNSPM